MAQIRSVSRSGKSVSPKKKAERSRTERSRVRRKRKAREIEDRFDKLFNWANRRMPFLKEAENKETFFRRISQFLPSLDPRYQLIEKAYEAAKEAHRGKLRSDGTRYFEHVRAVALILIEYLRVFDVETIITALLHDVVEDNPAWTIERVKADYGTRVGLLVQFCTKPKLGEVASEEERDRIYHTRFGFAPRDLFCVKLSDRFHNLITLKHRSPRKREHKIRETRRYYLPFAEKHQILYQELFYVIRELEEFAI